MTQPSSICECGHLKSQHIYETGACRPGFVCHCGGYTQTGYKPSDSACGACPGDIPCESCSKIYYECRSQELEARRAEAESQLKFIADGNLIPPRVVARAYFSRHGKGEK